MTNQTIIVNEIAIVIATFDNEKYVAIKPICEAIGINYSTQIEKIQKDGILSSVSPLRGITGADGKEYEMRVISLRFVFGWLFTINPKNVKSEIRQSVINYKMDCYNALFDTFTRRNTILKEKTEYLMEVERLEEELRQDDRFKRIQELKGSVKDASARLNALDKGVVNEQLQMFKGE